jgi:Up-regulated During Septation
MPMEATLVLQADDREALRSQACTQAERYEILQQAQVAALGKELRALDERCEYLRTTYRSLRNGRQKLHTRMLTYLKTDSIVFSRERVLKQMEAVAELDKAIDDWALKSERAEDRRLRIRQKLLEHVAGAIMLGGTDSRGVSQRDPVGLVTPPRSKDGPKEEESGSREKERKDVESIKIYADTQVLNLFSDIEQVIGRMCEAC